jgi:adenine-specific DNA-methyltransferase
MTDKDYEKLKQIEEAVQAFNSKMLYESTMVFFNALDYQSEKTVRLSSPTYEGLLEGFSIPKNTINKEKALIDQWKQIEFIFQVGDSEVTQIQSLFDTGKVDRNEFQSFLFFSIELQGESYKRSDLVKITREINLPFKMPVIVLFQYGNKLTLSIIDRRLNKSDSSKDVLEKVTLIKDIDITNPQRAHKEILKDLSLNELYKKFEFHSFVKLHEVWKATLNISELNKKFYKELAYWYFWALQEVEFPDDELKDDKTRNPVNVIRLITRLIFVWFLKEKNLIPDELFNKQELDKILDYKDKTGSTNYKAILQNLFFATLNTEMNKDVQDKNKISRTFVKRNTGVPHYFRYNNLIKDQDKFAQWMDDIPFLNGGLFECLDKRSKEKDIYIDGFTQQVKNQSLVTVPDYLFFSKAPRNVDLNSTFHTSGKNYEVRGLIDILSRYKFTIEENTPVEEEVALDPELLGKVFENLLASYNEETETTARKLTGSFYTPREIVNYMVDESLITYLSKSLEINENGSQNNLSQEPLIEKLHHLFSYTPEEPKFTELEKTQIIDAIDTCKILDPACGSGAFPMGILHKLVFILGKLDPNNNRWKQKQLDKVIKDRETAERELKDDKVREATLVEIDLREKDIGTAFNHNNHELDFARKLYLIENCIYGVDKQPVAIQISKLRFFIALIVDQKTDNSQDKNRGIRPLPNLETRFVAADSLISIDKPSKGSQLTFENIKLKDDIKLKEQEIHRVREKHFRARTPETKEKKRIEDHKLREELAELLLLDGFSKDATHRLSQWDPYDQNKYADFIDLMWMFEMEQGFDIIIGNPPYVSIQRMDDTSALRKANFETFEKTGDLYSLFYEQGINLLRENGILCYITSNKWINANYGKSTRKYFATKTNPLVLIDFAKVKIFESATVFVNILITEKVKNKNQLWACSIQGDHLPEIELRDYFYENKFELKDLGEEIWKVSNGEANIINSKIDEIGIPLSKWKDIQFFRGITSGLNQAFHIDKIQKEKLQLQNKRNQEFIKPLLRGKDIKRWSYKFDELHMLFIPWHFPLHNDSSINSSSTVAERKFKNEFPEIYNHLLSFKDGLNNRNQSETGIRYEWYALQRYGADFWPEFEKPKIVWIEISDRANYAYDETGMFLTNSAYFMTGKHLKYILAVLNSKVADYYFFQITATIAGGRKRYTGQYVEKIPIPKIAEKEEQPFNTVVDYILLLKENESNQDARKACNYFESVLEAMVYQLYFSDVVIKSGYEIISHVSKLLLVKNSEQALEQILEIYQEVSEKNHPIRASSFFMNSIPIIKEIEESFSKNK